MAQAIYAVKMHPLADRTVEVEMTPEIHYGPPQLRFSGGQDGILRKEPMRDRRADPSEETVQRAPHAPRRARAARENAPARER